MNPSPPVNRSFLHGNSKASSVSEKVVYATLDCLALKRTRLPLQLVPVDSNASDRSDRIDNDSKSTNRKASSRRPSFKVRSGVSLHWKQRHRVNLVTGKFEHTQKESASRQGSNSKSGIISKQSYRNGAKTMPELLDALLETGSVVGQQNDFERSQKSIVHRKKSNNHAGSRKRKDGSPVKNDITAQRLQNGNDNKTDEFEIINYDPESKLVSNGNKVDEATVSENNNLTHFKHFKKRAKNNSNKRSRSGGSLARLERDEERSNDGEFSKLKSLSREELRSLTISEPTNFVHVASATHPNLISNETSSGLTSVIKHDEKRASLPLIVSGEQKSCTESETKDISQLNGNLKTIAVSREKYAPVRSEDFNAPRNSKANVESPGIVDDTDPSSKKPLRRLCTYESVQVDFRKGDEEKVPCRLEKGRNPGVVKTGENEVEEKIYEMIREIPQRPEPNASFLWSSQQMRYSKSMTNLKIGSTDDYLAYSRENESPSVVQRSIPESNNDDYESYDEYDDVGPSRDSVNTDEYDDVGPLLAKIINNKGKTKNGVYDDVIPPKYNTIGRTSSECPSEDDYFLPNNGNRYATTIRPKPPTIRHGETATSDVDRDDAILTGENQYLSVNEYSSLEEINVDSDVYDDVGLPSQERVNSLYAGFDSSVYLPGINPREESEWEDLDETPPPPPPLPLPLRNTTCSRSGDGQLTPSKKKLGQTWSRKVRRQRCKASRDNSAKSSQHNTHDHTSADSDSDNSNYETLYSSHLDDFSSESEAEKDDVFAETPRRDEIYAEAPSRPTPPPPREESLTQTLGRRMKMLRRTWSLTKGSLGRIGKKSSTDNDIYNNSQQSPANTVDHKKYFSFKKHFRKNLTGLSTFYLENNEHDSNKTYPDAKDRIYSNTIWHNGESKNYRDNDSLQSHSTNNDPCTLLTEEPLYQFYAAAAARVAFESDSDGYEEVEDLIATRVTTDLTKPGQRTLWCQTSQVLNSGLLQRLTAEERKLQEAKFEILTSEASYLSSLRVLEEEFVRSFDTSPGIISSSEKEKLFGGISDIRMASERLLVDLERVWAEDSMLHGLPEILKRHAEKYCNIYVQYCSNQVSIDTTLKDLRGRKNCRFSEIVSRIESHPACQNLSLHSFLMLPMQRVTRLPLLADAVLTKLPSEHVERTSWEKVLSTLSTVVAQCNEGARTAGRQAEMEALARKLEYASKLTPITLRDRYLIRSGSVIQLSPKSDADYKLTFGKKFTKTYLYLFLLTDYLLIAKPKLGSHDETYTVIDTCKRSLIALESVSDDSPWAGRHAMILTLLENHLGRETEYVLTCDSDTEITRWLDVVSPPKSSLIGETLYESWDCPQVMAIYSYAPAQPDELALHPGDVINVLRKMADGWNHGEKLLDGEQGWFPANYTKEVASEHVRARNLKQRHRLLAVTGNLLQKRNKSNIIY